MEQLKDKERQETGTWRYRKGEKKTETRETQRDRDLELELEVPKLAHKRVGSREAEARGSCRAPSGTWKKAG